VKHLTILDNSSPTKSDDGHCKDEHFVAKFFCVSLGTVRRWRHERRGPRYRKLNNLVRYSMQDLQDWLDSRPSGGDPIHGLVVQQEGQGRE
jgi:hypothetical protein